MPKKSAKEDVKKVAKAKSADSIEKAKAPKVAKEPAGKKAAEPKAPKAEKVPKVKAAPATAEEKAEKKKVAAAARQEKASLAAATEDREKWLVVKEKHGKEKASKYSMTGQFEANHPLEHKTLGWGFILSNNNDRLEVLFESGVRILISNYQA